MKKDAIPGFVNELWIKVDEDKTGIYRGQCAELCGRDHGFMPIVVDVKSKADFAAWLAAQKAAAQPAPKARRSRRLPTKLHRPTLRRRSLQQPTPADQTPNSARIRERTWRPQPYIPLITIITTTSHTASAAGCSRPTTRTSARCTWCSRCIMFFVGGAMAMVIRAELFQPGLQFVDPQLLQLHDHHACAGHDLRRRHAGLDGSRQLDDPAC